MLPSSLFCSVDNMHRTKRLICSFSPSKILSYSACHLPFCTHTHRLQIVFKDGNKMSNASNLAMHFHWSSRRCMDALIHSITYQIKAWCIILTGIHTIQYDAYTQIANYCIYGDLTWFDCSTQGHTETTLQEYTIATSYSCQPSSARTRLRDMY